MHGRPQRPVVEEAPPSLCDFCFRLVRRQLQRPVAEEAPPNLRDSWFRLLRGQLQWPVVEEAPVTSLMSISDITPRSFIVLRFDLCL